MCRQKVGHWLTLFASLCRCRGIGPLLILFQISWAGSMKKDDCGVVGEFERHIIAEIELPKCLMWCIG